SPEGEEVIKKREQRQQEQGIRASSYHELENVLRDMYVNEQVVDIKKVPALRQTLHDIYQKKLFAEKNYLQSPLHQQFLYAMIREHFVPEEKCEVAKEVRKALNTMQRKFLGLPSIFEKAITGDFAKRLQAIWDLVEPTFTKFLEEDIKNQNQPENPKNEEKQ
ncbi:MAG: hypothetical protein LBG59_00380, partial [Candidatus Peribacteria bacterium]|nr:hypothetical protein [Candidatus Peribacteria bacterium]